MSEQPTVEKPADHQLFHRKHVVSLTWAVIGGLITATVVTTYQATRPPQKVIVLNPDTVTRTVHTNDSASLRLFQSMEAELRALRLNGVGVTMQGSPQPSASSDGVNPRAPELPAVNVPIKGAFYSPPGSKGYTVAALGTLAAYSCPASPVRPASEIALTAAFRSGQQVAEFSPIDVSINRERNDTVVRLLHQQYEAKPTNLIVLAAPQDTGHYTIEFGVFVRGAPAVEYPPLHEATCPLVVTR